MDVLDIDKNGKKILKILDKEIIFKSQSNKLLDK